MKEFINDYGAYFGFIAALYTIVIILQTILKTGYNILKKGIVLNSEPISLFLAMLLMPGSWVGLYLIEMPLWLKFMVVIPAGMFYWNYFVGIEETPFWIFLVVVIIGPILMIGNGIAEYMNKNIHLPLWIWIVYIIISITLMIWDILKNK